MKPIFLIIFFILTFTRAFSQVYVESTFTSINFQVSAAGNMYSSDVLFKDRLFIKGADFRLSLGISENMGILGGFQYGISGTQLGNQILPFTFSEKLTNSTWFGGLEYYLGSPQSKLRYKVFGQLGYSTDRLSILYVITDANKNLTLAGMNYGGGASIHYFMKSYLSLQFSGLFNTGKYTYSELEGQSFKENMSNSSIQFLLGLAYHFGGR